MYSLPLGVTAEMIADQRPVFARNMHRRERVIRAGSWWAIVLPDI